MATSSELNPSNGAQGSSYIYNYGTSPNTRAVVSQKVRVLTPTYGDNAAMHQIGVVATFDLSESKTVEAIRGIGFGDIIAELVPGVTDPAEATFDRAMLYLATLWQATGYAGGISGPVRSLRHHKWPFDIEQQVVFSSLADFDILGGGEGRTPTPKTGFSGAGWDAGVQDVQYPEVTNPNGSTGGSHSAIITMHEACWFTSWSTSFAQDAGQVMENGSAMITDSHDFASVYGEFMDTGNDPTIGQLGSIRYSAAARVPSTDLA